MTTTTTVTVVVAVVTRKSDKGTRRQGEGEEDKRGESVKKMDSRKNTTTLLPVLESHNTFCMECIVHVPFV